jgi:hypothetical protein
MKALSIRQPYAWLAAHGIKDVENRNWDTKHRGLLYIHASQTLHGTEAERNYIRQWVWEHYDVTIPDDDELPRGGIVGQANVIVVVKQSLSPWRDQRFEYGFILEQAMPLPFRRCAGKLGLFEVRS